ncbi:MAG TPA: hypothetical protein VF728_09410 [Nocardioides sp.]
MSVLAFEPPDPDFDLDDLIASALADTPDPRAAWEKVESGLDAATVWAAVRKMGPTYASNVAGRSRVRVLSVAHLSRAGSPRKADAARHRWEQAMASSVPLSLDGSSTKFLGDCSGDDVLTAASIRRQMEARNRVWAERFEALAEKMRCHRAPNVRELDVELFWEAMR